MYAGVEKYKEKLKTINQYLKAKKISFGLQY